MNELRAPLSARAGHWLSIAIGLVSIGIFATEQRAVLRWLVGVMFVALFALHVYELARGRSVSTLYPDRRTRLPMLAIELLAICAGVSALVFA